MPQLRTSCIVVMGTETGSVIPIPTKVALDKQTVASWVAQGSDMIVGALVFRAVPPIMTIVKTLKAMCGRGCGR